MSLRVVQQQSLGRCAIVAAPRTVGMQHVSRNQGPGPARDSSARATEAGSETLIKTKEANGTGFQHSDIHPRFSRLDRTAEISTFAHVGKCSRSNHKGLSRRCQYKSNIVVLQGALLFKQAAQRTEPALRWATREENRKCR
jgi:hypothetical protein